MQNLFNLFSGRFNGLLRTPLALRSGKRFLTKCSKSLTQTLRNLVLVGLILFLFSCSKDTPSKEYERNFVLKVLYDQSTKPRTTPLQSCIDNYNSIQICFATATEFSTITLSERLLAGTLSRNTLFSYQELCQTNDIPALGNDLSDPMKICNFNCNKSYFNTRKRLNTCTGSFLTLFEELGKDAGTNRCRFDCFKISNN